MGKALLRAAEEDARALGALGMAAWGISLPFWMKASWFRKHGYRKADRQGIVGPAVEAIRRRRTASSLVPQGGQAARARPREGERHRFLEWLVPRAESRLRESEACSGRTRRGSRVSRDRHLREKCRGGVGRVGRGPCRWHEPPKRTATRLRQDQHRPSPGGCVG